MSNLHSLSPKTHAFQDAVAFLLRAAKDAGASDIHLAPRGSFGGGEVRFRQSGMLRTFRSYSSPQQWEDLVKEFKRRAGLSFLRGVAQDTRFSDSLTHCDYRVSLIPTQLGDREAEQIVLRTLPRDAHFSLERINLSEAARTALKAALDACQGLVVITGPTGSGKTVLLMAALMSIDRTAYSVLTLEDPVEYALEGITQVQVTPQLSFSDGLRSFLRQDPDYILVGETRDKETAQALIQAANTGHVVLTTLHTNSAQEAFSRLAALGVDEDLARANATFVSAQRLAPKLCEHCKTDDPHSVPLLQKAFGHGAEGIQPQKSTGCLTCDHTGVQGRELLLEFIAPQKNENQKMELVQVSSLREQALELVKKGKIHALEALGLP